MALYEYECDTCGHRFEVIQRHSDPPADKCPVCGKPVRKLQSAPAFQFKGTGWYVTDYAKKDGGKGSADRTADATKTKPETGDKASKGDSAEKPAASGNATKASAASSSSPAKEKES
jgi:putative FmdB family regulatory protein